MDDHENQNVSNSSKLSENLTAEEQVQRYTQYRFQKAAYDALLKQHDYHLNRYRQQMLNNSLILASNPSSAGTVSIQNLPSNFPHNPQLYPSFNVQVLVIHPYCHHQNNNYHFDYE